MNLKVSFSTSSWCNDCDIIWDLRTLESSSVFVLKHEQSFPFQSTINTSFIES